MEDCQINTGLQAMTFSNVKGPITVTNNTIQSRLAFYDCADVITVDGNTFTPGSDGGPDIWLYVSRGLVQNNVMPNGLLVAGAGGYARATGNQIGGDVTVGMDGLLRLESNVLTGAMVFDNFFGAAGLVNDPVYDNTGLSPDDASTPVDFNGNGCADYPPHNDERDSNGNCYYEGVSVPTDPGSVIGAVGTQRMIVLVVIGVLRSLSREPSTARIPTDGTLSIRSPTPAGWGTPRQCLHA